MEQVFFPLDEELALLPGSLAPRQQEHLVHLASWMPFDKAAQMIEELLAVQTNEETVRQLTERMGACMEAVQTAEAEPEGSHESNDQPPLQRCVFSADGAMISLVHTQWAETRTVAVGELEEQLIAENKHEIHVGHLSYFSRLADASTFTTLAEVEMQRRKVGEAKEVCAVMDGADWLQTFTDRHRPDAVRILDFPHAAEHITKLLEAVTQTGLHFPPHMLDRCLHILKHRGARPLLGMADRLGSDLIQQKGVQEHLDYLRKREALMRYPTFRQQGWPIGSGMVESANKNVVEARLKGQGCIGNEGTSTPCSPYALPFAMTVGGRCGKRRWVIIASVKHSTGRRVLNNGYTLSVLSAHPLLWSLPLNLSRRQKLLLFLLRLPCQKPRSPVPAVFPVGANGMLHGSG